MPDMVRHDWMSEATNGALFKSFQDPRRRQIGITSRKVTDVVLSVSRSVWSPLPPPQNKISNKRLSNFYNKHCYLVFTFVN